MGKMEAVPWWIYLVVLGIVFSGYMAVKTAKKEQEIDNGFIEQEGEVYLKRMKQEKEQRRNSVM